MDVVPSQPPLPTTPEEVLTSIAGEIRENGHLKEGVLLKYNGPCCLVWNTTRDRLIRTGHIDLWTEAKRLMATRVGVPAGYFSLVYWNDRNATSVVLEMLEGSTPTKEEA